MIVPVLSKSLTKGACGRIGIVGGSLEYTGAPYFAAMASLLVGSDLVYIFTHKDAAPVIKSYSPDLIVFPILNNDSVLTELPRIFSRLSALVIGPGLSNCPIMLESAFKFIQQASKYKIPLIIDADALLLVPKYPKYFSNSILTPNAREFQRLFESFNLVFEKDHLRNVEKLAVKLNLTIISKGQEDVISNGQNTLLSDCESGLRRVGGLGDILAGTLGTFIGWEEKDESCFLEQSLQACNLVRNASLSAFKRRKRCMRAQDVLDDLGDLANDLLDTKSPQSFSKVLYSGP